MSVPARAVKSPTPQPLPELTPDARHALELRVGETLDAVAEPYPTGIGSDDDRRAWLDRYAPVRPGEHRGIETVARVWADRFIGLAAHLDSVRPDWPTPPTNATDAVIFAHLDRCRRVWESEWLEQQVRIYGKAPKRSDTVRMSADPIADRGEITEWLRRVLATSPTEFARVKDAVKRVVGDIVAGKIADITPDKVSGQEPPSETGSGFPDDHKRDFDQLPCSRKIATMQYLEAVHSDNELDDKTPDAEVYDWLAKHSEHSVELHGNKDTWIRYVREGRKALKHPKRTPRHGRPLGKSVVHAADI